MFGADPLGGLSGSSSANSAVGPVSLGGFTVNRGVQIPSWAIGAALVVGLLAVVAIVKR